MQDELSFLQALHGRLEQIAQSYRMADMSQDQLAPLNELAVTTMMRADELRSAIAADAEEQAAGEAALAPQPDQPDATP